ncbi:hypothetical protein [Marilutibacter alkalisoli]|uniref:DUF998 domain-containing protein n=1 Tax=Marilutibacter alkalisoli TaxID=2591633 RepID=A0A514BQ43_9GAMM|nr:hypothetical protein [Lysobacter alkalisoli]QDH69522.1 hypothetical protein FKV23_05010 [Lysobacter alkalisoli]
MNVLMRMSSSAPAPAGGFPAWLLPALASLIPLVAAHLAWWLSMRDGLVPVCNPYVEGCVSISRAARHGLGNHLFRLAMLPCATLQVALWWVAAQWLQRRTGSPARLLPWLGLMAGVSLALYATFLGTEGDAYRMLRRYGVTVYFGATFLALMAMLRRLSRQWPDAPVCKPLQCIALGMLAMGVASVIASAVVGDPDARDRWENRLEWHLGLWLTAMFAVIAWHWWRERLRVVLV